jgi:hypothetical protein
MSLDDANDNTISSLFEMAWNSANNKNNTGGYTLESGVSDLGNGASFNVTASSALQFGAGSPPPVANSNVVYGGAVMTIAISGTLPTLGADQQYVWLQGLEVDYQTNGSVGAPYYVMDTATLSSFTCPTNVFPVTVCPPLYPFQNSGNAGFGAFYDQPFIGYQPPGSTQGWFEANTYLAVEDTEDDSITLLDGVSWGFDNYVSPEPGSWMLIAGGIGAVTVFRRRRAPANS